MSDAKNSASGTETPSTEPEETLDAPVLDGADMSDEREREVDNERRGMSDPGLIRHPETGEKTPIPNEEG
ncbi:hypothetical protein [Leucobacter sp. GX24907]